MHIHTLENSALAWCPAKLCSSCTRVFRDQYISDYAVLFILNLSKSFVEGGGTDCLSIPEYL